MRLRPWVWLIIGWLCCASIFATPTEVAPGVFSLDSIQTPGVTESSGIIASRNYPGAFWTQNDSDEWLFSITKRGATLGGYYVSGVKFADWEDIAIDGADNLYLGDRKST